MMRRVEIAGILLGLVLVLGVVNRAILEKQEIVEEGRQVLLTLRPVDPRSLIQGDYMRLAYGPELQVPGGVPEGTPRSGLAVMRLDANGVASFQRLYEGGALAEGEIKLRYKLASQTGGLSYGAESFFFQEGQAEVYAAARYAILRVAEDGSSVLVGLADEGRREIKPEEPAPEASG